jgi:hypothetical protein
VASKKYTGAKPGERLAAIADGEAEGQAYEQAAKMARCGEAPGKPISPGRCP